MNKTSEALQVVETLSTPKCGIKFYNDGILIKLACKYFLEGKRTDEYGDCNGVDDLINLRELFDEFIQFSENIPESDIFFEDLKDFDNVSWNWMEESDEDFEYEDERPEESDHL